MSYVRNLWGNFTRIFTPSFVERQSESPRESEVTLLCENDECDRGYFMYFEIKNKSI